MLIIMKGFSRITTRTGDSGESSLYNGERRRKDHPVFEALGDMDELNCRLGLLKTWLDGKNREFIHDTQGLLVFASSLLASPGGPGLKEDESGLSEIHILNIEAEEHKLLESTELPRGFILPGETRISAEIDIARTVCRRCERRIVSLDEQQYGPHFAVLRRLLNRLSDYLFILARWTEQHGTCSA